MGIQAKVHDTELVTAIKSNETKQSHQYDMARLERHAEDNQFGGLSAYEDELRSRLSKAVFVGHINTDLDSVAGAMGAAALFGGTAALAEPLEKLNGEIVFALKNCGLEPPKFFDEFESDCPVCLVDHTEEKQMVASLRSTVMDRVVGVIDHHALAKSFQTKRPIYMDLRPWGSMSTIVGYLFVSHRRALPKPLAVLLLQAILSDTLNLRSVTATDADRSMVALLHNYGGIGKANINMMQSKGIYQDSQIDFLSKKQFQAKTNWVVALGPYEMTRGDQKDFACGSWKFGISVLEVTDTAQVLKCAGDILLELRLLKKEKALVDNGDGTNKMNRAMELDFAFLFVVNVFTQMSILLISGGRELALARAAFMDDEEINSTGNEVTLEAASPNIQSPGSTIQPNETAMVLPKGYVSRKAQFVPAFFKAIEDFEYEKKGPTSETHQKADDNTDIAEQVQEQVSISRTSSQRPQRRRSSLRMSYHTNAMEAAILRDQIIDEELIKVNADDAKERNGNHYDSDGRVIRLYDTGGSSSNSNVP